LPVTVRGTWPGSITLRSGWSKAVARPWNDDIPIAMVRMVRGSAPFLREASDALMAHGRDGSSPMEATVSPPLPPPGMRLWLDAGYEPWLDLDLYTRDLLAPMGEPLHILEEGGKADWDRAVAIDRSSFDELWRLGPIGLSEALHATPKSTFMLLRHDEEIAGFAIVGAGVGVSYLQRVAVDPKFQGLGYGRSLVRAAMHWGKAHGGRTMLLNTQPANDRAARLYMTAGFQRLPGGLRIARRPGE